MAGASSASTPTPATRAARVASSTAATPTWVRHDAEAQPPRARHGADGAAVSPRLEPAGRRGAAGLRHPLEHPRRAALHGGGGALRHVAAPVARHHERRLALRRRQARHLLLVLLAAAAPVPAVLARGGARRLPALPRLPHPRRRPRPRARRDPAAPPRHAPRLRAWRRLRQIGRAHV